MYSVEDVIKRITVLENANKGLLISPVVWDSLRKFVTGKLVDKINERLKYYFSTNDRLMHFVYAIAAVYTGDISADNVADSAVKAKGMDSGEVRSDVISKLINIDKGHRDRACQFTLKSQCGLSKATAESKMLETSVVDELTRRAKTNKVGLLIIHMYVDPSSLKHVFIGEGSALSNMVGVIEAAKKANVPIFLIWKHDDEMLGPSKLRDAVKDYKLVENYIWVHNSFLNKKDYAKAIKEKKLDDIIVMGYDADVCVKGTVFGSEYANPIPKREFLQKWDEFKMQHPDRLGKDKLEYESFLEKNKDKFALNETDYAPSLLELVNERVLTSRSLLLNDGGGIGSLDWGPLVGTRGIPVA